MYSGTWLAEQTGVKAPVEIVAVSGEPWWKGKENLRRSGDEPGRAKRMTFLLAHSLEA